MEKLPLVIVLLAALLIPLMMGKFKINVFPSIVAEIIVGIILGKSVLNIIEIGDYLEIFSSFGVVFLVFLSGMEIDFSLFKKKEETSDDDTKAVNPLKIALTKIFDYASPIVCQSVTFFILVVYLKITGCYLLFSPLLP